MSRSDRTDGLVRLLRLVSPEKLDELRARYPDADFSGGRTLGADPADASPDGADREMQRQEMAATLALESLGAVVPAAREFLKDLGRKETIAKHLRTTATLVTAVANGVAFFLSIVKSDTTVYLLGGTFIASTLYVLIEYWNVASNSGLLTSAILADLISGVAESEEVRRKLIVEREMLQRGLGGNAADLCRTADDIANRLEQILLRAGYDAKKLKPQSSHLSRRLTASPAGQK